MSTLDSRAKLYNPLMVPELFYNILECFRPAIDPSGKRALVALAQTCRAFSEPSLDCLWRKLYSLQPLIRCYATVDEHESGIPPTSSQFAVIDRYSPRILELTISEDTSVRFLQRMSMRPSVLLPNLMVLRWSPYVLTPHVPIIFIQRLLSPTLVSLEATLAEADQATLLSFFDNYPLLCQNLKSVEFRFSASPQSGMTIQALSRAICSQETLENVVLHTPIDRIALTHLCTSPTLKVLHVHLSERSRLRPGSFLPTDLIFGSVEELEFTTSDLDLVTSLLQPRDQIFHTFRLYLGGRHTSEAIVNFLTLLTSRSRPNPLRKLTLSIGDISHPVPADQMTSEATTYSLSYKTLQPLAVFGSLHELVIEWSEQISLDDDELADLARSWPLLRVFNFYCGRGGYPPFSAKYATLLGLLSLVNSCPELYTVSLPLDAREVPVVKEEKARETDFACLIVPESPIDQARPVAEFLCKYLPSVTAVDWRFLRPPGTDVQQIIAYERAWQQVDTHLEEFYDSSSNFDSTRSEV
ncbi:hypothetical protein J3R83DRAFT_9696 [Lanmaoa asiatica]|nr:hypothetical protein J3R83DRAFT_9696 [Lanmaoa asiatica]